jgi:predicted peptidase
MKIAWMLAASMLAAAALAAPSGAAEMETGFLNETAHAGSETMPYVVYVPRDYTPARKWPVVLFLHGSGERGTNGLAQTQVGLPVQLRVHPERFPCLVVMPQCPPGQGWGAAIPGFSEDHPETLDLAMNALDTVLKKYSTDPDRVYLTGLSMGGFGSWDLGSKHPERFAAMMVVCGGGDPAKVAPRLKDKPVWVFHGGADPTVPVKRSQEMVEALKAAGNTQVKYTEYPGVGHNSWDNAFGDPAAIEWLFSQKLSR